VVERAQVRSSFMVLRLASIPISHPLSPPPFPHRFPDELDVELHRWGWSCPLRLEWKEIRGLQRPPSNAVFDDELVGDLAAWDPLDIDQTHIAAPASLRAALKLS